MKNDYCIVDLETTSIKSFKRFANQFDSRNKIVMAGYLLGDEGTPNVLKNDAQKGTQWDPHLPYDQFNFIVGHNVKFDVLYLWKDPEFQKWLKNGGKVYDTMVAEYLLSGQYTKYASLNELSVKYGGELKDEQVTEMFKAGLGADEIDPELLQEYLIGDLTNTEIIFTNQIDKIKKRKMLPLVLGYMEHYLALCEMEANGLYMDVDRATQLRSKYETKVSRLETELNILVKEAWTLPVTFNPQSDEHLSSLLFNTGIVVVIDKPVVDDAGQEIRYKGGKRKGQVRTKKTKTIQFNEGFGLPHALSFATKKGKKLNEDESTIVLSTDKKILAQIAEECPEYLEFIETIISYREARKYLDTYLYGRKYRNKKEFDETGLIPLRMPHDGCIHHTLDTVQTQTGRVNSKNPNGQNIPADICTVFTSRFGDQGKIIEFDFSQLEVCVQAYLTQSTNLIRDIKQGVDFHCKRLAYAVDKPYADVVKLCDESKEWKAQRRKAKTVSFQKAYGARPEKIAATTKLPLDTVEKIFNKEDEEYPEIQQMYNDVDAEIKRTAVPTGMSLKIRDKRSGSTIERQGETQMVGYYQSLTGKRYNFKQKAVLTKRGDIFRHFSPTEVFNYPVQGTAADIVALQVAKVFRKLLPLRDKAVMINEVHDSLLIDCKIEHTDEIIELVTKILGSVNDTFQSYFNTTFNVPIDVDVQVADSWGGCKQ